jgi:hypothetical protein
LTYAVPQSQPISKPVEIFSDELQQAAHVIHLEGLTHRIGHNPYVWSTRQAMEVDKQLWRQAFSYTQEVVDVADSILDAMGVNTGSYACVHLRRGIGLGQSLCRFVCCCQVYSSLHCARRTSLPGHQRSQPNLVGPFVEAWECQSLGRCSGSRGANSTETRSRHDRDR